MSSFNPEDFIIAECSLLDKRTITVEESLYGRAKIGLHAPHTWGVYDDVWDFPSKQSAMEAIEMWGTDREPKGWHRHPKSIRYRIGGSEVLEYIRSEGETEDQIKWAVLVTLEPGWMLKGIIEDTPPGEPFPEGTRAFLVSVANIESPPQVLAVYHYLDHSVVLLDKETPTGIIILRLTVGA